ncbi:MAG: hypothetical protein NC097_05135 [Clostridium sp.]|nr:hypothetical protein [Prevotella sp.]MCM1429161.1 hypothetical protein [Clostridium sp.]MCM1475311.1 hypothetical protein [Muribaculaceae bacterium]
MRTFVSSFLVLLGLGASISLGACTEGRRGGNSDSLPQEVREIVEAVENDDADRFSMMVSYPLVRPYPLRDIEDADQMRRYYRTLVDDSLKRMIAGEEALSWKKYGWRGWGLDDGSYIWVDSLIYAVPYLSKSEKAEQQRLVAEEIASLSPEMRKGWVPLVCFREGESGDVFRIDRHIEESDEGTGPLRMAIYREGKNLGGKPWKTLHGKEETEGTMENRNFSFTSADGTEAVYRPDNPSDGGEEILLISDGKEILRQVEPVYWLDLREK